MEDARCNLDGCWPGRRWRCSSRKQWWQRRQEESGCSDVQADEGGDVFPVGRRGGRAREEEKADFWGSEVTAWATGREEGGEVAHFAGVVVVDVAGGEEMAPDEQVLQTRSSSAVCGGGWRS